MNKQTAFQELCVKNKNQVLFCLNLGTLLLRVVYQTQLGNMEIYDVHVQSLQEGQLLSKFFDTLEDLKDYLKDPNHFQIDTANWKISILQQINTKKSKIIQIAQLQLHYIQTVTQCHMKLVQDVLQICHTKDSLSFDDIKSMFKKLSKCIAKLLIQKSQILPQQNFKKIQPQQIKQKKQLNSQQYNYFTMNQFADCLHKITQNQQQIYNQLSTIKLQINNIHHIFQTNIIKQQNVTQNIINKNQQISNQIHDNKILTQKFGQKLSNFSIKTQTKIQKYLQQMQKLQTTNNKISQVIGQIISSNFVDLDFLYFNKLMIRQNYIIARNRVNVFGKSNIFKWASEFSVQICKMKKWLGLGVIDIRYKKLKELLNLPNWIAYRSDKYTWDGKQCKQQQGKGFVQGQTITIKIDRIAGTIEWIGRDQVKLKLEGQIIKDNRIQLVPLIYLEDQDDAVKVSIRKL